MSKKEQVIEEVIELTEDEIKEIEELNVETLEELSNGKGEEENE